MSFSLVITRHSLHDYKPTSIMARSAQLILFFVVAIALFVSCHAFYQDKSRPDQPCKGGPLDQPKECGSQCPPTCGQPEIQACILSCKLDACECAPGSFRRLKDGKCVARKHC